MEEEKEKKEKKKRRALKKTKEVSVAMAESSSITQPQTNAPRKRGRPKKIITEEAQEFQQDFGGTINPKNPENSQEEVDMEKKVEEMKEQMVGLSSNSKKESPKEQHHEEGPRRSRRKSKPRKSS